MNYENLYRLLIERAKNREALDHKEIHHIVPKCLGGSDDPLNLVALTPREHYIAHWLLWKMKRGRDKHKMAFAFFAMASMSNQHQRREISSRQFERAKIAMRESAPSRQVHRCHKGKRFYTNGVSEGFFLEGSEPSGWKLGRSDSYKAKIKEARKRPSAKMWTKEQAKNAASKGSSGTRWWINPDTGEERRSVTQPDGFILGQRVWFTKDSENRQFVDGFQPSGWVRGRTMTWKRGQPTPHG